MRLVLRSLLATAMIAAPATACAGEFNSTCHFSSEALSACGENFSDLVTDRFIERFPADRYELFIYSMAAPFDEGGMVAHAVAGVVPLDSHQFPQLRFQSSRTGDNSVVYSAAELGQNELEVARNAVKQLMETCDETAACEVFLAREESKPAEPAD